MRKILFCFLLITCMQFGNTQKVTFGVKGGGNLASFNENFDSPFDYQYKFGFQLGGLMRIELADRLFLQPELLYSLQGTKFNIDFINIILPQTPRGTDEFFENINDEYVNESTLILPILLKYYVLEDFNVELGPQLDYIFHVASNELKFEDEGIVSNNNDDSVSDFNFGINLGLGYDINENFGLGARYNYGFNRLFKGELAVYANDFKRRNSVFSLNLEYRFN